MKLKTEELTRDTLMSICENSIVHCTDWVDRNSAYTQDNIEKIYTRLHAGVKYTYTVNKDTIWIDFEEPTKEQMDNMDTGLDINTIDDYRALGLDDEMFVPGPHELDEEYHGYLPTIKRLKKAHGKDWY